MNSNLTSSPAHASYLEACDVITVTVTNLHSRQLNGRHTTRRLPAHEGNHTEDSDSSRDGPGAKARRRRIWQTSRNSPRARRRKARWPTRTRLTQRWGEGRTASHFGLVPVGPLFFYSPMTACRHAHQERACRAQIPCLNASRLPPSSPASFATSIGYMENVCGLAADRASRVLPATCDR